MKQRRLFEDVYSPGSNASFSIIKDGEYIGWIRVLPVTDRGVEKIGIVYGDWIEEDDGE